MTSLTTRGRVAVVAGFVASAALCAGAAVALVKAADHTSSKALLPPSHPTLDLPTSSPTAAPSPSSLPTPTATPGVAASPSPSATTRPPASRTPRATQQPTSFQVLTGPEVNARLDPGSTDASYVLSVTATDSGGTLTLTSVDWGDGVTDTAHPTGTACHPAPSSGVCATFLRNHTYPVPAAGQQATYYATVTVSDGTFSTTVHLPSVTITNTAPSPTASP